MTTILRAQPVVSAKLEEFSQRVAELKQKGLTPKMRVILVGDNPASLAYVGHKEKLSQKVGCHFELIKLPQSVSKQEFLNEVEAMNQDPSVTGCFVQLPVPKQLQDVDVTELIAPEKDVDGFGSDSIVDIYKGKDPLFTPCTPKGILKLLEHYEIPVFGKSVTVVGKSLIVGKPMAMLLSNRCATVTICHSKTEDLAFHTKNADIVISAVGKARFLGREYFKSDKSQTIIDVGICRDADNKLCGDVDYNSVIDSVAAITPVPGGVGPLTVMSLIDNLILATEKKLKEE